MLSGILDLLMIAEVQVVIDGLLLDDRSLVSLPRAIWSKRADWPEIDIFTQKRAMVLSRYVENFYCSRGYFEKIY